jgi:hypothetical protein
VILFWVSEPGSAVVPKMCCADPKESATGSQVDPWIHFCNGYFEVYLLFRQEKLCFVKNNHVIYLICDMFISYNRYLIYKPHVSAKPATVFFNYTQIMKCLVIIDVSVTVHH